MFDITIEQKVLMKALEYLEPTVGKNASNLGDNCIAMSTTGNGSIEMYTTNTIECTRLEAIVSVGGNTQENAPYVDFKRFKTIIASIPSNEMVSIRANVNDLLINFALKKTPIKLVGSGNGMIPLPNNVFPTSTAITISKNFIKKATEGVCSIITDTVSSPIYNCMRIATSNMSIEITALDINGKRTFIQNGMATNNNPQQEVLIEASKLKKSLKLFEDFNEMVFYMDANTVKIEGTDMVSQYGQKTGGMINGVCYYARRINGIFPNNVSANFNPMPTEFMEINKAELLNSFTRVKALEDQSTNGVIGFEVANNNVCITMNSAYGDIQDEIMAENTITQTFKTMFKYDSLSDIMKVIDTETFEIGVLPKYPTHYVVKSKGGNDIMFTVSGMANTSVTP